MYSDNKQIRDVADAAAKIMYGQQPVTEKLHSNQQVLDVHEPEKDELTADDFKKLRAKKEVKKEEVEAIDEDKYDRMLSSMLKGKSGERLLKKHSDEVKKTKDIESGKTLNKLVKKNPGVLKTHSAAVKRDKKIYGEEVEELDEVKMADLPSTKVQGRSYGSSRPEPHAVDVMKGPKEKELKDIEAEKKKKKFSEMVNLYQEKGLKSLSEMLVKEEPDNEQFTKELEDAKAKSEGKKRNTEIAKGAVQAVKQEELDIDAINGVQMSTIEEDRMNDAEKAKKEDIVKSMKKGMAGFKDRYGDRAKNVMYATATKQAMKD